MPRFEVFIGIGNEQNYKWQSLPTYFRDKIILISGGLKEMVESVIYIILNQSHINNSIILEQNSIAP